MSDPSRLRSRILTTTSGTTTRKKKKNPFRASATPLCGRRSHSETGKQHRRCLKDMKRSAAGSRNYNVLTLLYAFTGHIPRSRLPADQAVRILEISQRLGQHLVQGNLPRTWIELKRLMDALKIDSHDTLAMQKHTAVSKLFRAITRDERPEWNSLPAAALKFYTALGVELRPLREQFGIDSAKRDPLIFDPDAWQNDPVVTVDAVLEGPQLTANTAMAGSLGNEAFGK